MPKYPLGVDISMNQPDTTLTDIEFGLGYDDSELYGDVVFFSLYAYFYGAN